MVPALEESHELQSRVAAAHTGFGSTGSQVSRVLVEFDYQA